MQNPMKRGRDDSDSEDSQGPISEAVNNSLSDHLDKHGLESATQFTFVPTTSRNPVWSGFTWSLERDKHGRRNARCKFCNCIFSGRPMRLKRHFVVATERCKAAPEDFIENYTNLVNSMLNRSMDQDDDDNQAEVFEAINSAGVPDSSMKTPIKVRESVSGNTKLNMIPSTSHNPIWSGFFWSIEKDKHGRRTAQCKFCNLILGGRPMRLKRHFLVPSERCPAASEEFVEYYKNLVKMYEKDRGIEETESIESEGETPANKKKRAKLNESTLPTDGKQHDVSHNPNPHSIGVLGDINPVRVLNLDLLKSLVYSNLPGDLVQANPYFQRYLGLSSPNQLTPNDYSQFMLENLPILFHECESMKKRWIEDHTVITLSIVKLKNLQGLHAYAVYGVSGMDSCFLGVSEFINLNNNNLTNYLSEWFLNTLLPKYFYKGEDSSSVPGHGNNVNKVIGFVSEMSGDFHQLHNDVIKFHPHIHHIPSILDSLQAVTQEIAKIPAIQNVVKRNVQVIHSLLSSPDWSNILHDYHLPKDHAFYTKFLTQNYGSIFYLCRAVQILEPAIKDIYNLLNLKVNKYNLNIHPNEVKALLHYENYFQINSEIVILLHPIIEIIQQIQQTSLPLTAAEKQSAAAGGPESLQPPPFTVGHIYQFFLQINFHIEGIEATTATSTTFQLKHCIELMKSIVFKRLLVYSSPIFAIGFYLIPKYRQLLLKHKYTNLPALFQQIHELNSSWNHWKSNGFLNAITTPDLEHYHNNTSNLFTLMPEEQFLHPIIFWNHVDAKRHLTETLTSNSNNLVTVSALIQFAKQLFSIPVSTYAQELVLQQSNIANAGFLSPLTTTFTTHNAQEYDKLHQWMTVKYALHVNYPIDGLKSFDTTTTLSHRDHDLLLHFLQKRFSEDIENQLLTENTSYAIQNKINKDIKHYVKGFVHYFNTELYKTIYESELAAVAAVTGGNTSSSGPLMNVGDAALVVEGNNSLHSMTASSVPSWTIQDLFFSN